jgi:hypothetical protein
MSDEITPEYLGETPFTAGYANYPTPGHPVMAEPIASSYRKDRFGVSQPSPNWGAAPAGVDLSTASSLPVIGPAMAAPGAAAQKIAAAVVPASVQGLLPASGSMLWVLGGIAMIGGVAYGLYWLLMKRGWATAMRMIGLK